MAIDEYILASCLAATQLLGDLAHSAEPLSPWSRSQVFALEDLTAGLAGGMQMTKTTTNGQHESNASTRAPGTKKRGQLTSSQDMCWRGWT